MPLTHISWLQVAAWIVVLVPVGNVPGEGCVKLVINKNYVEMHGQQNVKLSTFCVHRSAYLSLFPSSYIKCILPDVHNYSSPQAVGEGRPI